jgi:hypothetical protein
MFFLRLLTAMLVFCSSGGREGEEVRAKVDTAVSAGGEGELTKAKKSLGRDARGFVVLAWRGRRGMVGLLNRNDYRTREKG